VRWAQSCQKLKKHIEMLRCSHCQIGEVGQKSQLGYPAVIAGLVACKEKSYAPALANKGFTFKFPIDKNSLYCGLNIQKRQLCVKGILAEF
jgi:hypothetical protein